MARRDLGAECSWKAPALPRALRGSWQCLLPEPHPRKNQDKGEEPLPPNPDPTAGKTHCGQVWGAEGGLQELQDGVRHGSVLGEKS